VHRSSRRSFAVAALGLAVPLFLQAVTAAAATPKECEAVAKQVAAAAASLARVNPALREGKPDVLESAGRGVEAAGAELGKLPVTTEAVQKIARDLGGLFGRLGRSLRDLASALRNGDLKTRGRIHDEFRVQQEEMLRHIRALKGQCQASPEVPASLGGSAQLSALSFQPELRNEGLSQTSSSRVVEVKRMLSSLIQTLRAER
jgi:hypothetical protein